MTRAFLSISFAHRHHFTAEINTMRQLLAEHGIELFVFVDVYAFTAEQAAEMMQTAVADLKKADFLIAEVTHKAIGVGVEVGVMAALERPIVYIRRTGAPISTTVGGLATHEIVYDTPAYLGEQLRQWVIKKEQM